MHIVSALSTEYVRCPVAATVDGGPIVPISDAVALALVPAGSTPGALDWHTGSWETDNSTTPATYFARLLVGPNGGALTLTAGVIYDTFLRITDNPEAPVRNVGALGVL